MLSLLGKLILLILDLFLQLLLLVRWIKLLFVAVLGGGLIYYGLTGIVSNLKERKPRPVTYADLVSAHPEAAWVRLEGASLRFADTLLEVKQIDAAPESVPVRDGNAASEEEPVTKSELERKFLIPIRAPVNGVPDLSHRPSIVLQTADLDLVRRAETASRSLSRLSTPGDRLRWELAHRDAAFASRSFTGIAMTPQGMSPHDAARLENLRIPADGNCILLFDGRLPERIAPIVELGLGVALWLLLAYLLVSMRRAEQEAR